MFPDLSFGRPLPVQDAIDPRESGNGYALRMVAANHLEFCDLTRALCTIGHRYLPFSAASRVAYWFGADPVSVARAFPHSYRSRGHLVAQLMGNEFHRPYHIRVCRPQVCGMCLQQHTWARLIWDVSLVTCCPQHKVRLVDRCPSCNRALRWRRPDVESCLCGYNFRDAAGVQATADEIWFSDRVEGLLFGDAQTDVSVSDAARCLLASLSLDPLLRLVRTLGIVPEGGGLDIVPGKLTRLLTSAEATAVVVRAFSRLRLMLAQGRVASGVAPISVGEARSLCEGQFGPQSDVLHALLNRVARVEHKQRIPERGSQQLHLFAEEL
jgi:hypothetical protein